MTRMDRAVSSLSRANGCLGFRGPHLSTSSVLQKMEGAEISPSHGQCIILPLRTYIANVCGYWSQAGLSASSFAGFQPNWRIPRWASRTSPNWCHYQYRSIVSRTPIAKIHQFILGVLPGYRGQWGFYHVIYVVCGNKKVACRRHISCINNTFNTSMPCLKVPWFEDH